MTDDEAMKTVVYGPDGSVVCVVDAGGMFRELYRQTLDRWKNAEQGESMATIRETVTEPREVIVGYRCDWCGMEAKHRDQWGVIDYPHTFPRVTRSGCEVKASAGESWPDDTAGSGRKADLCFDCATKVLDWLETQGAKVETYDW